MIKLTTVLLVLFSVLLEAGCAGSGFPGADGRYATNDRGRSNNRAALPDLPSLPLL